MYIPGVDTQANFYHFIGRIFRCYYGLDTIIWWCYFCRDIFFMFLTGGMAERQSTIFKPHSFKWWAMQIMYAFFFWLIVSLSPSTKSPFVIFYIMFGMSSSFISCATQETYLFHNNLLLLLLLLSQKSRKCFLSLLFDTVRTQHIANRSFWHVCALAF